MPRRSPEPAAVFTALALGLASGACTSASEGGAEPDPAPAGPPQVITLSHPAAWLVQVLLPTGSADATLLLPKGTDPAAFRPDGAAVARLAEADLLVANGAGYEAWTETASLPRQRLVSLAADVALIESPAHRHSHGDGPAHTHGGPDPHTWMDPQRYGQGAAALSARLQALLPADRVEIDARREVLAEKLDELDQALRSADGCAKGRRLAANHPSFTYLAQRLSLDVQVFDLAPDAPPAPQAAAAAQEWAGDGPRPVLLWEAPPAAEATGALPAFDHLALDPLEQPDDSGRYDYLVQAHRNVAVLQGLCAPAPGASGADDPPR